MLGWQAVYAHARKLESKDEWTAATAAYERLMCSGQHSNAKVLFRLGHAYFRLNRLDESQPLLQRAVELQPSNAAWHYRLGFVFERQKSFGSALAHYQKAMALGPGQTSRLRRIETCKAAIAQWRFEGVVEDRGATWQRLDALRDGADTYIGGPSLA